MIHYETHKTLINTNSDIGFTHVHYVLPFYSFMMLIGILAGAYILRKKYMREKLNFTFSDQIKSLLIITISTMVGGRFFYLIFLKQTIL